jgi:hypothetical protein
MTGSGSTSTQNDPDPPGHGAPGAVEQDGGHAHHALT